jgi:hypothetical protein
LSHIFLFGPSFCSCFVLLLPLWVLHMAVSIPHFSYWLTLTITWFAISVYNATSSSQNLLFICDDVRDGGNKFLWKVSRIASKQDIISHKTVFFINSALKISNHMRLLVCKMGHNYGSVKKLKAKCWFKHMCKVWGFQSSIVTFQYFCALWPLWWRHCVVLKHQELLTQQHSTTLRKSKTDIYLWIRCMWFLEIMSTFKKRRCVTGGGGVGKLSVCLAARLLSACLWHP